MIEFSSPKRCKQSHRYWDYEWEGGKSAVIQHCALKTFRPTSSLLGYSIQFIPFHEWSILYTSGKMSRLFAKPEMNYTWLHVRFLLWVWIPLFRIESFSAILIDSKALICMINSRCFLCNDHSAQAKGESLVTTATSTTSTISTTTITTSTTYNNNNNNNTMMITVIETSLWIVSIYGLTRQVQQKTIQAQT